VTDRLAGSKPRPGTVHKTARMTMVHPRGTWLAAALLVLTLASGACASAPPDDPAVLAAGLRPGTLLDAEPIATVSDRPDSRAWHIRYVMQGVSGDAVAASGMVIVPAGQPPESGWPRIGWGHPTRGSADECAPSREGPATVVALPTLLDAGLAVVAPDYEGLGVDGPHPYLVGESEARSMLDALTAATEIDGAGLRSDGPVVLWGFSQGGHAVGFAAQRAPELAPDMDLRGVVLAAPVSDVTNFARRAEARRDQLGVLVTILAGQRAADPTLEPRQVLSAPAAQSLDARERQCIGELNATFGALDERRPVVATSVSEAPAWMRALHRNRLGDATITVPALIIQGTDDDIVDPADTRALVERWCAFGVSVTEVRREGEGHAVPVNDVLVPWIHSVLHGGDISSTCLQ